MSADSPAGRLAGQVAVITGASRGIGRSIAVAYAGEGADVVCAARSRRALEETAGLVEEAGARAVSVVCDVTDDSDVASLRATAEASFGFVDVLVNNAGMHLAGRFEDFDLDDWQRIVDVNVLGTVRVTRAFLPRMVERGRGRVINMASTAGKYGSLFQSPYNATKHAVVGLTRCLALEAAGSGVRVNAICPGFVDTEMIDGAAEGLAKALGITTDQVVPAILQRVPIGRMLQPEEIAELAAYLASPAANGMTGQAITLAGGLILI